MRSRKTPNLFSRGKVNRLIDDLVHPFFNTNKGSILIDGVLHGLVEQNPTLSLQKFVKYNLPRLVEPKNRWNILEGRKRSYSCMIPVNTRCVFCSHKKAGPGCLRVGSYRLRCSNLLISYKPMYV